MRAQGFNDWYIVSDMFGGPSTLIRVRRADPVATLGRRLSNSDSPPSQADVDALLAAVPDNPRALAILAFCFIHGCNGIDTLPPEERLSWSLRSARDGYYHGMLDVIEQTRASDAVTAYQWTGFARELAVAGCDPMPGAGAISQVLKWRAAIGSSLTPSERALADQHSRELLARYGDRAMAIQHCAQVR
jgi:hypothetical protein